jgi:hypothetical protein
MLRLQADRGLSSVTRGVIRVLTAKPMVWPCVKHAIEGCGLDGSFNDCWYSSALQAVPWMPSNADISVTVVDGSGNFGTTKEPLAPDQFIMGERGCYSTVHLQRWRGTV